MTESPGLAPLGAEGEYATPVQRKQEPEEAPPANEIQEEEEVDALIPAPDLLAEEDDVILETEEIDREWAHSLPGEDGAPLAPMPDDDGMLETEEIDLDDDDDDDDDVWLDDDNEITDGGNTPA